MTSPELYEPRFPDDDVWLDDLEYCTQTVIFGEVSGEQPRNINHLSKRTREVIGGSGVMTIAGVEFEFNEGETHVVPKGVPTSIVGAYSMLTTVEPLFMPIFCTQGDEKLARKEKKLLKKFEKSIERIQNPFNPEQLLRGIMRLEQQFSEYRDMAYEIPSSKK